jgi:phosphatidylinositol alpha-mannosyltransferase
MPEVRLIVVGPGELDEESARIIAERGLRDVEMVGRVTYEELAAYYQLADVFCSPATGNESQGIVLLEAMAAGKPVVASNIPGYASVLDDGMQGRLINPKDEEEFARVLEQLLRDPVQRLQMGENGRIKSRRYDWQNVAQRVMAFYDYCLEKRARGGHLFPSRALS